MLRNASFAILAIGFLLSIAEATSPAYAKEQIQDSYCLQGRGPGYPGSCQFSSYQQCMATASGTDQSCGVNPMKLFPQQRQVGGAIQRRY